VAEGGTHVKKTILLFAVLMVLMAACGGGTTETTEGATSAEDAGGMEALVAAAQEEGTLTTIALPHDWCNYGAVIEGFKTKYGLAVNELVPLAGSAEELEAIEANKENPGPQAPDVVDIGLAFGPQAITDGLITPYKVETWDTIPAAAKEADGYWYGDYYGVLAFEVNTDAVENVPQDWADLLKPEYNGQVALPGNPIISSQPFHTVWAAALANGGSLDDPAPGLEFWRQVVDAGNFVPAEATGGTIASGETPITIRWSYNALLNRDSLAGNPEISVVVPPSGRLAGMYVQAVSAYAPHPNAARLWMEYLYSDEGQLGWLSGYCNPIRYEDMVGRGVVPADLAAKLPDTTGAAFPTLEQVENAQVYIAENWDAVVGVTVIEAG
jgi:putative spermidine/putrescine transport system substrate-binding protein